MSMIDDTAILLLTCNDFEAMEIVVDRLLRTTPVNVPIYILSNCPGLPGADVCADMSRMASQAHYGRVRRITPNQCQPAYFGIRDGIAEHISETYIVKFDDDVFPLEEGWLEELIETYERQDPDRIAYVTGLVNNNPYGFSRLVQLPGLKDKYREMMGQRHVAGAQIAQYDDVRVVDAGEAHPGSHGTVWQFPQLARWIHEETTLQPQRFKELVSGLGEVTYDPSIRYSINVMLFHRDLWSAIDHGGVDDEEMLNIYCAKNDKKIVVRESTPFIHLYFGPQKQYLKDLLPLVRDIYGPLSAVAGHPLVGNWDLFKTNYALALLTRQN